MARNYVYLVNIFDTTASGEKSVRAIRLVSLDRTRRFPNGFFGTITTARRVVRFISLDLTSNPPNKSLDTATNVKRMVYFISLDSSSASPNES